MKPCRRDDAPASSTVPVVANVDCAIVNTLVVLRASAQAANGATAANGIAQPAAESDDDSDSDAGPKQKRNKRKSKKKGAHRISSRGGGAPGSSSFADL